MFLIKFQFKKKNSFYCDISLFWKKNVKNYLPIYIARSLKEPILFFSIPPNFVKVTLPHCIVDVTEEKLALKV